MADRGVGPTSRTYFSQRLRLHYVDWGNTDKPALLLLHGGRDHCRSWDWTAEARDQARVICFLASSDADFVTGVTIDVTGGV